MANDTITELTSRDFTDTTIFHDSIGGGRHRLRVFVDGGENDVLGDWYGARELAHLTHEGVDFIGFHPIIAKQLGTTSDLQIFLVDEGNATP